MTSRKSVKPVVARSARDLTKMLDLDEQESAAIELRVALLKKIIAEVNARDLTHAQAAGLSGTSRSRMTAILNGAIQDVSTDLLLRILAALGVRAQVRFSSAA